MNEIEGPGGIVPADVPQYAKMPVVTPSQMRPMSQFRTQLRPGVRMPVVVAGGAVLKIVRKVLIWGAIGGFVWGGGSWGHIAHALRHIIP